MAAIDQYESRLQGEGKIGHYFVGNGKRTSFISWTYRQKLTLIQMAAFDNFSST